MTLPTAMLLGHMSLTEIGTYSLAIYTYKNKTFVSMEDQLNQHTFSFWCSHERLTIILKAKIKTLIEQLQLRQLDYSSYSRLLSKQTKQNLSSLSAYYEVL